MSLAMGDMMAWRLDAVKSPAAVLLTAQPIKHSINLAGNSAAACKVRPIAALATVFTHFTFFSTVLDLGVALEQELTLVPHNYIHRSVVTVAISRASLALSLRRLLLAPLPA